MLRGARPGSFGGPPKKSIHQPSLGEYKVATPSPLKAQELQMSKANTSFFDAVEQGKSGKGPDVFRRFQNKPGENTSTTVGRLPVGESSEAKQSEPPARNKPVLESKGSVKQAVANLQNQGAFAKAAAKASTSISVPSTPVVNVQKIANAASATATKELEPGAPKQGPGEPGAPKQGPGEPGGQKLEQGGQKLEQGGQALGGPKTPRKGKEKGKETGNGNEPPRSRTETPGAQIVLNPATVTPSKRSVNGSSTPAVVATSVSDEVKAAITTSKTVAEVSGPPPKNNSPKNLSTRAEKRKKRKKERNEKKKANKQAGETSTQVGPVERSIETVSKQTGEVTSTKNLNGSPMTKTGNGFEISHFAQRKKVSRKELKRLRTLINNKEGQIQRATRKPRLKGVRWFFSTILGFDQGNIFRKYKSSIFGRKTKVSVEQLQGELQELKGDLEGQKQKYANDIFKAQAELEEKQSRIFSNAERRRKKKTGENQTFTTDIKNLQDTIKDLEAKSEGVDKIIKTLNDGTLQEEILIKQEANEAKRTQRANAKKTPTNILKRTNTNNAGLGNLFGNEPKVEATEPASGGYFNIRKIKIRKLKYRKSRSHTKLTRKLSNKPRTHKRKRT
jgi:hypothetical protein